MSKDKKETEEEAKHNLSPHVSPVATPTVSSTPQVIPKAIQIEPNDAEFGGYSAVNVLSILPDEVRTEENLEGGSLPPEQAHQLLTQYTQQRKDYEEREMKKMAAAASTPSSSQLPVGSASEAPPLHSNFTPGYEDVEPNLPTYDMIVPLSKSAPVTRNGNNSPPGGAGGEYEDPADAVAHDVGLHQYRGSPNGGAVVAPKSQISPEKPKKFQFTSSVGERYTDVYNPGGGETIGQSAPTSKRAMSDVGPDRLVNGGHSPSNNKPVHHYQNTSTVSGGGVSSSGDSLDDVTKGVDQRESVRKHKSAKEEVEFDPTAKKVFRVTSTRKKRATNGRDLPDGDSNGDSSPDAKSNGKEKQFNLSDEFSGEEYSMVNVADKQKYRPEDDIMKKEGSGIPQRYSTKSTLKQEVA